MAFEIRDRPSPNFSQADSVDGVLEIPVEFLVIHYTACDLERALAIFSDPERKVCAHFVIDQDGTIYDLGGFWSGPIRKGAHAGISVADQEGKRWESFNAFSIGIELINLNGNIFDYTSEQYDSLAELTIHLYSRFPVLSNPARAIGHEQIAGFRGKVDPGMKFDWERFYKKAFPGDQNLKKIVEKLPEILLERLPVLNEKAWLQFQREYGKIDIPNMTSQDWSHLSSRLEAFVAEANKGPLQ